MNATEKAKRLKEDRVGHIAALLVVVIFVTANAIATWLVPAV